MAIVSASQRALIEPVLFAVRNGKKGDIGQVLVEARRVVRAIRQGFDNDDLAVHMPSYDLGAATTFVEMLATSEQRATLNDAVNETRNIGRGIDILREVAISMDNESAPSQGEL